MDIRNWLISKNKTAPELKKRRIEDDDDDDVIPESPDVQIINKKKKLSSLSTKSKKTEKDKLKEVKSTNLFGNGSIKRTEPIVKKETKKTETGIHSDEEFEKSLLEIDEIDEVKINGNKNHDDKPKTKENGHQDNKQKSNNKESKHKMNGDIKSVKLPSKSHKEDQYTPSTSKDISQKVQEFKKEIRDTNKRKFTEFIDDTYTDKNVELDSSKTHINDSNIDNHDVTMNESTNDDHESKSKKRKVNKSLNESALTDEERHERKMHSAKLYQSYLNRTGPKHLGSKEMPEGSPNCLKDCAFLLTGVLDSFEREDIVEAITKYGGCVKSGISKKVTHVLAGEDAGPAKTAKAQELGIPIISEDDFLKMIKNSKEKSSQKEHDKDSKKDKEHHRKSSRDKDKSKKDNGRNSSKDKIESSDVKKEKSDHKEKESKRDSEIKKEKSEHKHKRGEPETKKEKLEHIHTRVESETKKEKSEDKHTRVESETKKEKLEHIHTRVESETKKEKSEDKHTRVESETKKEKSEDKHTRVESETKKEKSEHKYKKEKPEIKKEKSGDKPKESSTSKLEIRENNCDRSKSPAKVDVAELDKIKSESQSTSSIQSNQGQSKSATDMKSGIGGIMWVDKHKPQTVKQIIGQTGDNSNVNKLINWLTKWYVNRKAKLTKPSPWAKNDDGGYFKAALLSGPPGVGKTTTVALVCKQLGFDMVELNASDARNKTLMKEQIGELLTTHSLSAYAKGDTGKQAVTKKHVLVMDEVDGMAGNEDRGGLQELIGLIKSTSVPIVCMCNDRNSQKMRSLVNYCYDLRFSRPRVEQIKAAMRSICCKENIKIPPDVLGQLIVSANQDVRQTLNLLSMWAIDPSRMEADRLSKDAAVAKKDVKLGPWDAIRKVFSSDDHKTMSINDRSDLFFYDYSLAPLFVQENYLQVQPHCPKHEVLQRFSQAADCISFGDIIEKRIRGSQSWSLLPMQAMFSSVLPGHYLSGHMGGQIQFPGWLGKNSRATKMHRLCQEIHAHTRLSTTGSKSSIFLDYSTHLRDAIINPLIKDKTDGIEQSLQVLESYNLLREDLDNLTELSVWPGHRNPTVLIDSKVKAAMTRMYNKKASALPYAPGAIKRAQARDDDDDDGLENEDAVDVEEEDSDVENDGLIKKKKSQQAESSSGSDKPGTSKGKSGKGSSAKGKKK